MLGDHVAQKGSLVAPERLRFDISHPKPISREELERVEDIANEIVLQNSPVTTRLMAVDDAIASGARALFGEKYGDEVRVVAMGDNEHPGGNALGWSVELCGGTHVRRTGDIGLVSVRRRKRGRRRRAPHRGADRRAPPARRNHIGQVAKAAARTRSPIDEMPERIAALHGRAQALERDLADARRSSPWVAADAGGTSDGGAGDGVRQRRRREADGPRGDGIDLKDLNSLADEGKKQVGSGVVAIVGVTEDGKAGLVVGVTADLVARFNAVDLVSSGAEVLGGKGGGGRPDMAQAGGPDGSKADAALDAVAAALGG